MTKFCLFLTFVVFLHFKPIAQCTLSEIYLIETARSTNNIYRFVEIEEGTYTYSFDEVIGPITIKNWVIGMDLNPSTGEWFIIGSPDGDRLNRHLYKLNIQDGTLSNSLGQVQSSSGERRIQAFTFDGDGNLWGAFGLGGGITSVEQINIQTLIGTPSTIVLGVGTNQGLGAVGMTWDFDMNEILVTGVDLNERNSLFRINPFTQNVLTVYENVDLGQCEAGISNLFLQGIDYAGSNNLVNAQTFLCNEVRLTHLNTQDTKVMFNPSDFGLGINSYKDVVFIPSCIAPKIVPTLAEWSVINLFLMMMILFVVGTKLALKEKHITE